MACRYDVTSKAKPLCSLAITGLLCKKKNGMLWCLGLATLLLSSLPYKNKGRQGREAARLQSHRAYMPKNSIGQHRNSDIACRGV